MIASRAKYGRQKFSSCPPSSLRRNSQIFIEENSAHGKEQKDVTIEKESKVNRHSLFQCDFTKRIKCSFAYATESSMSDNRDQLMLFSTLPHDLNKLSEI